MSVESAFEITEMAAMAAHFVNSTGRNVFLTGKAGTGKTTFLHQLAQSTHKRYVILAPTGIAALNAGGVTIHSQFLLPFGTFIPERKLPADLPEYGEFHDRDTLNRRHPLNAIRRQVLRAVDLLIIDEVSMLRADLLDAIDHRMRSVRGVYDRAFGGAQVLLIGDLHQLPPVVKDNELRVLQRWYASPHFFEAHVIREAGYAHIELDKIFRQQDGGFIEILNNLRNNTVTPEDVERLNLHYRANLPASETKGVITLTTHNRTADALNMEALEKLPGKASTFEARVEGDFHLSMYPVLNELELKVGAQVMFVRNDPEKVYFNGKLARVVEIRKDQVEVEMLDLSSVAEKSVRYVLKQGTWENKRYALDPVTKEQKEELLGTFSQYPVKLAWAITVHKSQGLTFDRAIIDVGKAFAPGQVYVALSRLRSLDGLMLRTRIDPSVVMSDRDVIAFDQRGKTQQPLPEQLKEQQQVFLQAMLISTFDLGDLLKRTTFALKDQDGADEFEDESMRSALSQIALRMRTEEENTRTFQAQLVRLLQEGDHVRLVERIGKGTIYYTTILKGVMKELLQHLAQVESLSRTKQYADTLREIDGMLVKKIASIDKAEHVTTSILQGRPIERRPEREKILSEQRHAAVEEIKVWLAGHQPKGATKSGRRRKAAGPGTFTEKKEKKPKKVKGETYLKSYAALKAGWTIAQVAAERGLSHSTIEGHVVRGIEAGEVEIAQVMEEPVVTAIGNWMRDHGDADLNAARAHFDGSYSYGQIRMVRAWLKNEKG